MRIDGNYICGTELYTILHVNYFVLVYPPNLGPPLLITKSNKHKLSLESMKFNKINGAH